MWAAAVSTDKAIPAEPLNSLGLVRSFLRRHVREGALCIDATAGRGRDTVFLSELTGESGHVVALDIQNEAVESTRRLIDERGFGGTAEAFCDDHANIGHYASEDTVDCIVFNLGWLPGGDHSVFTRAGSSVAAIGEGLRLLRSGGVMSVCIYYGRENGTGERDAVLEYLRGVDPSRYTVVVCKFANRANCPPIPVFIIKD